MGSSASCFFGLGDGGRHQTARFGRGLIAVVHPADLFANVGVLIKVRVHVGALDGSPKRQLMQAGRAGGHHHPVNLTGFNVLLDQFLARVRAHEHIGVRGADSRNFFNVFLQLLNIHMVGNIAAAMAYVYADFLLTGFIFIGFR
jgi:hypothetical protein